HKDRVVVADHLDQLRQLVGDLLDALDRPHPLAGFALRALPEVLRLESDNLKQETAIGIFIVVVCDLVMMSIRLRTLVDLDANALEPIVSRLAGQLLFGLDQIEDTAANGALVIVPSALFEIDG